MISDSVSRILQQNLQRIEKRICAACARANRTRQDVKLIAVTKTVASDVALALFDLGVTQFGESRPQVLWKKADDLPHEVEWHLIGHLQTNKIPRTLPLVKLLHSVDRERLLNALEKEGKPVDALLEVNASREENKHGFAPEALTSLTSKLNDLENVRIHGLMTMAAWEENPEDCRSTFVLLRDLLERLRRSADLEKHPLGDLSMGMSNDFEIAIEEGATLVRIGSALFEGLPQESG